MIIIYPSQWVILISTLFKKEKRKQISEVCSSECTPRMFTSDAVPSLNESINESQDWAKKGMDLQFFIPLFTPFYQGCENNFH